MRKIQSRFLIPNGFTALSMFFGLSSIAASAESNFVLAAWMIVWGVLLDKLDGTSARLLNACSEFGVEFDSFADFVVFGMAPAALVYFRLSQMAIFQEKWHTWMMAGVSLYAIATAVRLARFNIVDPPDGDRFFHGIPTTVCGGFIGLLFLVWDSQGLPVAMLQAFPIIMVTCAVAMVSNIRLSKLKSHKRLSLNLIQGSSLAAAFVLAPLMLLPEFLLGLEISYVSIGLVWGFASSRERDVVDVDADEPRIA